MNLVYTTDNNFIPQVAAGMCSVMENNREMDWIHFYIVSDGVTPENQAQLSALVRQYGRELTVIELDEIASYFDFEFDTLGWRPVILARLLLDRLLPPDVDRVLYLDGDTIVRGNLAELWQTDMGDAVIGACVEPTMDKQRKIALGMENVPYFNSGVLLIDLDKWRKQCTGQRIIQFYDCLLYTSRCV